MVGSKPSRCRVRNAEDQKCPVSVLQMHGGEPLAIVEHSTAAAQCRHAVRAYFPRHAAYAATTESVSIGETGRCTCPRMVES
jgi:hypothetical protein